MKDLLQSNGREGIIKKGKCCSVQTGIKNVPYNNECPYPWLLS